jgi:hypothetical protein
METFRMRMNQKVHQSLLKNKPINVQQGGSSSGKTYTILQHLFMLGAEDKETITVIAEDVPNLKSGAYRSTSVPQSKQYSISIQVLDFGLTINYKVEMMLSGA